MVVKLGSTPRRPEPGDVARENRAAAHRRVGDVVSAMLVAMPYLDVLEKGDAPTLAQTGARLCGELQALRDQLGRDARRRSGMSR